MSDQVKFNGKVVGSVSQTEIGLWQAFDKKGKLLALFPNRTRAVDAILERSRK